MGEVLAAAPAMKAWGLRPRAFFALIAIADRAFTETRQASVPWSYIQATIYEHDSYETAKHAVKDLVDAGLIRKVKRGIQQSSRPISGGHLSGCGDRRLGHLRDPFG